MAKSIPMRRFMQALFDDEAVATQAAEIGGAILEARSSPSREGNGSAIPACSCY